MIESRLSNKTPAPTLGPKTTPGEVHEHLKGDYDLVENYDHIKMDFDEVTTLWENFNA